jgi:hypothetical protein
MRKFIVFAGCVLVLCVGCGSSGEPDKPSAAPMARHAPALSATYENVIGSRSGSAAVDDKETKSPENLTRKIISKADVRVIVDDFDRAEQQFRELISRSQRAYVARAEIVGSSGSPREGHWTIRVPASQFSEFVTAVTKLGVPQKNTIDSSDVTEEYYDLEARVKNKKVEETRLLKHLEASTGKLEEILTVEKELSRVRSEIEQQEGRLRLLASLTAMTTVTVALQEIKNYVPPQAPTFSTTVSSTFFNSVERLVGFGESVVLVCVALGPWLPVIAVIGLPIWLFARRYLRRARARQPA